MTFTFSSVTFSGNTTVTTYGTGQPPPSGFKLGTPPAYYEITTTVTFTSTVEVCINYNDTQFATERSLKLFHWNGSGWDNITTSVNTTANIICGNTTSFSPFIVAEELSTAVTISNISAQPDGNQVIITWSTSFEIDNEGFVILRSESPNGPFTPITQGMIPAMGGVGKATYTFTDGNVDKGKVYYYRLQDIDTKGRVTAHQVIPVTVAVAGADKGLQETASTEDNATIASQQDKALSNKDIMDVESGQPGKPANWMSVVVGEPENRPAGDMETPPTPSTLPRTDLALPHKGGGDEEEGTISSDLLQLPSAQRAHRGEEYDEIPAATNGVVALRNTGPSSFSVSIEDDKGNIIVVSKVEDKESIATKSSDLKVNEESDRVVLTWQGRSGVKGFLLHRAEKGKENYATISNLIPYFGRDDKDIYLYRFTDNSVKPGVRYAYRLEIVKAEHKGELKMGKSAE